MPFKKGTRPAGRQKGTPNKATEGIRLLLNTVLHDTELRKRWKDWLDHKDEHIAWEAFKLSQAYMFGKPVQPIVGDEDLPPVQINISAIPLKRERA
jgi:hypothetical protein